MSPELKVKFQESYEILKKYSYLAQEDEQLVSEKQQESEANWEADSLFNFSFNFIDSKPNL